MVSPRLRLWGEAYVSISILTFQIGLELTPVVRTVSKNSELCYQLSWPRVLRSSHKKTGRYLIWHPLWEDSINRKTLLFCSFLESYWEWLDSNALIRRLESRLLFKQCFKSLFGASSVLSALVASFVAIYWQIVIRIWRKYSWQLVWLYGWSIRDACLEVRSPCWRKFKSARRPRHILPMTVAQHQDCRQLSYAPYYDSHQTIDHLGLRVWYNSKLRLQKCSYETGRKYAIENLKHSSFITECTPWSHQTLVNISCIGREWYLTCSCNKHRTPQKSSSF